jgi:hypothetical protein
MVVRNQGELRLEVMTSMFSTVEMTVLDSLTIERHFSSEHQREDCK